MLRFVFVSICELMTALLTFSGLLSVVGLLNHFLFVLMSSHPVLSGCLNKCAYFVPNFHYFLIVFHVLLVLALSFYLGIFLTFEFVSLNYITLCLISIKYKFKAYNSKIYSNFIHQIYASIKFMINKILLFISILSNWAIISIVIHYEATTIW